MSDHMQDFYHYNDRRSSGRYVTTKYFILLTILLILQLTTSPAQQNLFPQQQQLQPARFQSLPSLETQQLGQQQVKSAHFGLILAFLYLFYLFIYFSFNHHYR
jgi:hypothetical protein